MTRTLAVDPAKISGFAYSDGTLRFSGSWNLSKLAPSNPDAQLDALYRQIAAIHKSHGIDQIAYEQAPFGMNDRAVGAHYEKIAIIKLICVRINARCGPAYLPTSIKKYATGDGRADKSAMMIGAQRVLGITPADDNEADALWILDMAINGYEVPRGEKKKSKPRGGAKDLAGQLTLFGPKPRRVIRHNAKRP